MKIHGMCKEYAKFPIIFLWINRACGKNYKLFDEGGLIIGKFFVYFIEWGRNNYDKMFFALIFDR